MACNVEIFRQNNAIQAQQLDEALSSVLTPADLTGYYDNPLADVDLPLLSSITYQLNTLLQSNYSTIMEIEYPDLNAFASNLGVNAVNLSDMVKKTKYTLPGLQILFDNTAKNGDNDVFREFLSQLDTYYGMNYGATIENGMCANIKGFLDTLKDIQGLVGDLMQLLALASGGVVSFVIGQVKGIIAEILSVKRVIIELINKLKEKFKETIEGLVDDINAFGEQAYTFLLKKVEQTKEFFSDLNMNKLISVVENAIEELQGGFENAIDNPFTIPFLLYRVCQMTESVQAFLQSPINAFQGVLAGVNTNTLTLSSLSEVNTRGAIVAGAFRIPHAERVAIRAQAARSTNRAAAAPRGTGAVIPKKYATIPITDQERQRVAQIRESGYGNLIRFAAGVTDMGKRAVNNWESSGGKGPEQWDPSENYPEAGWKQIVTNQPQVFIKILRVAERMQEDGHLNGPFTILSGFRSRWYNRIYLREIQGNKGAAWNSQHMDCNAIDVAMTGINPAKFIEYASQEGFKGVGVYPNSGFVHVDLGSRRKWFGEGTPSNDTKNAIYFHDQDKFRLG
jgi:hypothetical protein